MLNSVNNMPTLRAHIYAKAKLWKNVPLLFVILYTYIAHQTIKLSLMHWMRILKEQECFKARLNEVMETEFRTL